MTPETLKEIILTTIASLGVGATVLFGLASWLGSLSANRILQSERGKIEEKLKNIEHELSFSKTSYSNHLSQILDYYSSYYNHYRRCQLTASAEIIKFSEGDELNTQEYYFEELDEFQKFWSSNEGKIRLILPERALQHHEISIDLFNAFNEAVKKYRPKSDLPGRVPLEEAFKKLDEEKSVYEKILREYLRTEKMLSP